MAISAAASLNPQPWNIYSHLLTINPSFKLPKTLYFSLSFPLTNFKPFSPLHTPLSSFQAKYDTAQDEDEDHVLGDCLVFEEGIFDDPFVEDNLYPKQSDSATSRNAFKEVKPQNLIPDKWLEAQKEVNITKKERRKLALELEFGRKVERRRLESRPLGSTTGGSVSAQDYVKYRDERLKQLKPLVLQNPIFDKLTYRKGHNDDDDDDDYDENVEERPSPSVSSGRVVPRNPKLAVYGGGLEDITEFFNSGRYDSTAVRKPEGQRKLFSKEEKQLLNKRIPDHAAATSGKWHPLHTLAATGEFYLVNTLMKYNIDINVKDKNGLTAIHKAILGRKQAIFNYLLRESANPFICDREGATLMHYAVRTASSQMIKILLLYNVDINQQDNDGWTPLHLAVQSRRTDVVRLLLIKGANKTLRNKDGLMPLDLCLRCGKDAKSYELIKLLKQMPKDGKLHPSSSEMPL